MRSSLRRRDNGTTSNDEVFRLPHSPVVPMPITVTLVLLACVFALAAVSMTYKDSLRYFSRRRRKKFLAAMPVKDRQAYKIRRAQEIVNECHRNREDDWDITGVKRWPDDIPEPHKEADRLWNWRMENKDKFEARKKRYAKEQNLKHFFKRVIDGGPQLFAQAKGIIGCFPLFTYHQEEPIRPLLRPLRNPLTNQEFESLEQQRNFPSSGKDDASIHFDHRVW